MDRKNLHRTVTLGIALVWVGFGLFCKVLQLEPRHEAIVAHILGDAFASPLTRLIGVTEILMAVWILSGFKRRLNATVQIAVVGTMNVMETALASHLLLWGQFNALFAACFMGVIYFNEWVLSKPAKESAPNV
jgi:hypothetical protein